MTCFWTSDIILKRCVLQVALTWTGSLTGPLCWETAAIWNSQQATRAYTPICILPLPLGYWDYSTIDSEIPFIIMKWVLQKQVITRRGSSCTTEHETYYINICIALLCGIMNPVKRINIFSKYPRLSVSKWTASHNGCFFRLWKWTQHSPFMAISGNDNCTTLIILLHHFPDLRKTSPYHAFSSVSLLITPSLLLYSHLSQLTEPGEISFWLNDFFWAVGTLPWRLRLPRPPPFCVSVCIEERVVVLTGVSSPQKRLWLCGPPKV